MTNESNLIERINMLCELRGITIYRLEKDLHLARNTIKNWKEESNPTCKVISLVADYFSVSIGYLLGRSESDAFPIDHISKGSLRVLRETMALDVTVDEAEILTPAISSIIVGYRKLLNN